MSGKGVKRDKSGPSHEFTGSRAHDSDRKKEKKKKKHNLIGERDGNSNQFSPFVKKRKTESLDNSCSNRLFTSNKDKSKSYIQRDTTGKSISGLQRISKAGTVSMNAKLEDSSDSGTDSDDMDEETGNFSDELEGRLSHEAVTGTSGQAQGSPDEATSHDSSSDGSSEEEAMEGIDDEEDIHEDEEDIHDDNDDSLDHGESDDGGVDGAGKESDEYAALKKELASIPLEDLIKVKERIGLKVFNKIMHGDRGKASPRPRQKKTFKRENKNRPREMSSKRPVPVVRHMDNISQKHRLHRDPRFDDLSGEYKDEYFEKNYAFLDELKEKEKKIVKKELKKTEDSDKKKELQGLLMRMKQKDQVREIKNKKKAIETAWKTKEKEMVKEGKLPYFLKKSEKRKLELAEKYRELQKSGNLEKYLTKKRKKNAQKERKKLPKQMN